MSFYGLVAPPLAIHIHFGNLQPILGPMRGIRTRHPISLWSIYMRMLAVVSMQREEGG